MSPTSTDRRADAAFRHTLAGLVVLLLALVAVFLTLDYLQGPKLSSARVDARSVVTQAGQQLRLFTNQAVAQVTPGQVTVQPQAAVSVTTQGTVIAVQFAARLDYSTRYTVTVRDVTSVYQAQPATLRYSFTTANPTLYYLHRGSPNDDIVTTPLGGAGRTVVYSAPHIQDFAVVDRSLAVVSLAADHTSSLALVSLTDGAVEQVRLPEPGVVQKLGVAGSGTLLGFTFTSAGDSIYPNYSATLMTLNLEGSHVPTPVAGIDGKPLRVLNWEFLPDGSALLALSRDNSLFVIDPLTAGTVSPLGQFTELGPVSRDGSAVTVLDPFGSSTLTLASGAQARFGPSPLANDSSRVYLGPTQTLANGTRLEKVVIAQPSGTKFASAIVRDDGATSTVVYRTPNDAGSINSFSVSPNGQYVAIEVVPDVSAAVSDGYYFDARAKTIETVIVDIATGAVVASVEGFGLAW